MMYTHTVHQHLPAALQQFLCWSHVTMCRGHVIYVPRDSIYSQQAQPHTTVDSAIIIIRHTIIELSGTMKRRPLLVGASKQYNIQRTEHYFHSPKSYNGPAGLNVSVSFVRECARRIDVTHQFAPLAICSNQSAARSRCVSVCVHLQTNRSIGHNMTLSWWKYAGDSYDIMVMVTLWYNNNVRGD